MSRLVERPELGRLVQRIIKKPTAPTYALQQSTRKQTVHRVRREKPTAHSIFPETKPMAGFKTTEEEEHKIRKHYFPLYKSHKMSVWTIPGLTSEPARVPALRMQLLGRELKEIEEAGGLEARLISAKPSDLSNHGRVLRSALMDQLSAQGPSPTKAPTQAEREAEYQALLQLEAELERVERLKRQEQSHEDNLAGRRRNLAKAERRAKRLEQLAKEKAAQKQAKMAAQKALEQRQAKKAQKPKLIESPPKLIESPSEVSEAA